MSAFDKFAENQMAATFRLPERVKNADEAVLTPPQKVGAFYADPVSLEYPCHNATSTIFSTGMLLYKGKEKNAKFDDILERLKKSAEHFGALGEFNDLNEQSQKLNDIAQEKLADDQFALVSVFEGQVFRQFPIRNAEEIKAAANYLVNNLRNFRFIDRNKIARKILTKAHEFECKEVCDNLILRKTAGCALADGKTVGDFLRKVSYLVEGTNRAHLVQVAEDMKKLIVIPSDMAIKIAGAVDDVYRDVKAGNVQLVEDNVFSVTREDLLETKQAYVPFGGEFFNKAELNRFGKEAAISLIGDRAQCLYSILPIKPTADDDKCAKALVTALASAGIR